MKIKNWDKFQHFKDRRPPWIKLHRDILEHRDINSISDGSFRVLVGMWLLASEDKNMGGELPPVEDIAFRLRVEKTKIIKALKELDAFLIQDDINAISSDHQDDDPERETETEKRQKQRREDICLVFEFWKSTLSHPRAKLDDTRKKTIKKALDAGYSVDDCKDAITGCSSTPFNMGANDSGQTYDSLDLILRNAEKIDRFIANALNPPTPKNDAERRVMANIEAAKQAMEEV